NLSLGGDAVTAVVGGDQVYTDAIDRAVKAGIVVVAAAGNDSLPICEQPSVQGKILCVGAVDKRGMRSFFSSSGNITAPGGSGLGGSEDILSTFNDGKYTEMAGTSQATPHVSGVAALVVSRGLHGQQVVDRIIATASPAAAGNVDTTGVVNARAAVAGLGSSGGGSTTTGGGAGTGTSPAAGISYHRTQTIHAVLRHGVRVRCRTAAAGRCKVVVKVHGRTIATGSRRATGAGRVTVAARVTRAGRRLLRHTATRRRGSLSASVPGASNPIKRAITLVR
ncbi:MAG: serine protease, partial [Thermoleophilaceae bacterium]|nr:serine protease [Thermoleophilaceae bacterium]